MSERQVALGVVVERNSGGAGLREAGYLVHRRVRAVLKHAVARGAGPVAD